MSVEMKRAVWFAWTMFATVGFAFIGLILSSSIWGLFCFILADFFFVVGLFPLADPDEI